MCWTIQIMKLFIMQFYPICYYLPSFSPNTICFARQTYKLKHSFLFSSRCLNKADYSSVLKNIALSVSLFLTEIRVLSITQRKQMCLTFADRWFTIMKLLKMGLYSSVRILYQFRHFSYCDI